MNPLRLLVAAVVLTGASAARAQVAFFVFTSPLKGPSSTLSTSHEGLIFTITSPNDIQSVDLVSPGNGITGRFVQRWASSGMNGVYDVTNPAGSARNGTPTADGNFDSHLLSNAGTSISNASEGLGTNPIIPGAGEQLAPFPVNTMTTGYRQSDADGFVKGLITVNTPGVRTLDVAYVVEPFSAVWDMRFSADLTTSNGTTHVMTAYIPEPGGSVALLTVGMCGLIRRRRRLVARELAVAAPN
jgi:hypothetical protein